MSFRPIEVAQEGSEKGKKELNILEDQIFAEMF